MTELHLQPLSLPRWEGGEAGMGAQMERSNPLIIWLATLGAAMGDLLGFPKPTSLTQQKATRPFLSLRNPKDLKHTVPRTWTKTKYTFLFRNQISHRIWRNRGQGVQTPEEDAEGPSEDWWSQRDPRGWRPGLCHRTSGTREAPAGPQPPSENLALQSAYLRAQCRTRM